jgi:hypothetical protein
MRESLGVRHVNVNKILANSSPKLENRNVCCILDVIYRGNEC